MQAPLGITVIFGLSMSTILTLIVVPVVYTWFEDLGGSILTRRLPWLGGANRAYGRSVE